MNNFNIGVEDILDVHLWPKWIKWLFFVLSVFISLNIVLIPYINEKKEELNKYITQESKEKENYIKNYNESINHKAWKEIYELEKEFFDKNIVSHFPKSVSVENLLFDVAQVGSANNVIFLHFKPVDYRIDNGVLGYHVFHMSVVGGFYQIAGFIDGLSKSDNFFDVKNIEFEKNKDGRLIATMELTAYQQENGLPRELSSVGNRSAKVKGVK